MSYIVTIVIIIITFTKNLSQIHTQHRKNPCDMITWTRLINKLSDLTKNNPYVSYEPT